MFQIWIGFFSIALCNGLMTTYSKTFGLTFINDDHFYAKVAILQNFFNGTCRIFWGYFYDKLSFKKCFMIIGFVVTVATASLPVLPLLGKLVNYMKNSNNKQLFCCRKGNLGS